MRGLGAAPEGEAGAARAALGQLLVGSVALVVGRPVWGVKGASA